MVLSALALLLLEPPSNTAEMLEFDWYASDECPHELEIRQEVEALLRAPLEGDVIRVSGQLLSRQSSYELMLEVANGVQRTRHELRGYDCDELGWLAAQLIADTLDPFVFALSPPPSAERSPPVQRPLRVADVAEHSSTARLDDAVLVPAPLVPQVSAPPDVEPQSPTRPRIGGVMLLDGSSNFGVFPGVGGGPRLALGFEVSAFRAVLGGGAWLGPGFRGTVGEGVDEAEVGGRLRGWAAELGACGLPSWRQLEFPICARAGAGQIVGTGVDVTAPRTEAHPWVWLGADLGLEWWVRPRFGLLAGLGGAGSLARPVFHIIDSSVRYETPAALARAHVGVAARFGRRTVRARSQTRTELANIGG